MAELPSGTVTFLFTDLVSSTRLWEEHPEPMRAALARHDELVRTAIEANTGHVVKMRGDGAHAVFADARDAVDAAVAAQLALGTEPWPLPEPLVVRIGIHSGPAELRDGDYYGSAVNRAARLVAVAHGGQIVVSHAVAELTDGRADLRDLGEHRLRDLGRPERVFQVLHPELPSEFPRLRSLDEFAGNLPVQLTPFIGREHDVSELTDALGRSRLVTLVGVGGVGKTRLALHVAADSIGDFGDGVWFVTLAGVGDQALFDDSVAAVLGVEQSRDASLRDTLLNYLREKHLLLILDNCEHLVTSTAGFVDEALAIAPRVRVVVTSREGIGVAGERVFPVPVLAVPDPSGDDSDILTSDAVRLFLMRANDATGATSPTEAELRDIALLCRRLDGIPLAIELAAARRRSMTPAEILTHLDRRFQVLTGGRRTAVGRHHTMRNAIDWSYELLGDDEKLALHRLAVFAGSFDLDAAESVVTGADVDVLDVLDVMSQLVDKSLVVADATGARTRYRLFETIRDYAWERLEQVGEVEARSRRHADHYASFAEHAGEALQGPDEPLWVPRVREEVDNLHAAVRWAIHAEEADLALRLVAALTLSASAVGNPFGALAEEAAAMRGAEGHRLRPVALASAAFSFRQTEPDRAIALAEAGVAAAGDSAYDPDQLKPRCIALGALGSIRTSAHPEDPRAIEVVDAFVVDARRLGDRYLLIEALNLCTPRDLEFARAACEEALEYARELANPSRLAFALLLLARVLSSTDADRARRYLEEAVAHASSVGHQYAADLALQSLAVLQWAEGDYRGSVETLVDAAEHAIWSGDLNTRNVVFHELSRLLAMIGAAEAALTFGIWAEQHDGVSRDAAYTAVGADELLVTYDRILTAANPEELHAASRRAEIMTERELVDMARATLS